MQELLQLIGLVQRLVDAATTPLQRCSSFLILPAGTNIAPSISDSVGWEKWARFAQLHVSSGAIVQVAFAKDLGTIGPYNPASWEAAQIVGPGTSQFLSLPVSGQMRLLNSGAQGYITVVFLASLGG